MHNSKIKFNIKFLISVLLFSIFLFWLSGTLLDGEAKRVVNQLYPRNEDHILTKMQPVAYVNGHSKALVLIHGFQSSPAVWAELIQDINPKLHADIYAPLLPFHGNNLETLSQLDMSVLEKQLKQSISELAKKYQSLTVVGFSLSGAVISELLRKNELPKNVQIVLYNPALFLKDNNLGRRMQMHLYSLWRKYCNYPSLGCDVPHYASGDSTAKAMINTQPSLLYNVVPAALALYQFDLVKRDNLEEIKRPYHLIISKDDNYVPYDKQKVACEKNHAYCQLYTFQGGRHLIHASAYKKEFEDLLVQLVNH